MVVYEGDVQNESPAYDLVLSKVLEYFVQYKYADGSDQVPRVPRM